MEPKENAPQSKTDVTKSVQASGRHKLWRRPLKVVVALVAIATIGVGYLFVDAEYGNRLWPKEVTGLMGIEIGASRADVLYKKGAPYFTDGEALYQYEEFPGLLTVEFSHDKVIRLKLFSSGHFSTWPRVAGISTGTFKSHLTRKLGEPDAIFDFPTPTGAVSRSYAYGKLGVVFNLEQDRVVGIIVK